MSVNGWIDKKVVEVLEAFGVELPGGDGGKLRAIARAWDAMGDDLTALTAAVDLAIGGLDQKDWSGPAYTAFVAHWGEQKKAINDIAGHFHEIATGLRTYADQIDGINESIVDIGVQIAEMEIAGAALSIFTGFLSDIVANTAVAAKVAKIVDLVKVFTAAAEKVTELLEKFTGLSEEMVAVIEKFLTSAAKFSGEFAKTFLQSFVTNFVADSGSAMAQQAVSGQPVTVGQDLTNGRRAAFGTALFTAGGASLASGANLTGTVGKILSGEGRMGTTFNGALGNIAGGLNADLQGGASGTVLGEDVLANAATGAAGNAANHKIFGELERNGSFGGKNLSDRGKLADAGLQQGFSTGLNTAVYAAGSGIETDLQNLAKDADE
ncbi:hypothetical protein GCM10009665_35830 [Kitasatospora nipponensis]|uniref:Outer membrane channel protein CpnT-like N-terminal domain-containing protein n=1 Tax=Kitasatospora nipponensis TaxID=258049 RepID=A0ABN1WC40_9ACTN